MCEDSSFTPPNEAMWRLQHEMYLADKVRSQQLWRDTPIITTADVERENAAAIFRLQFFYGIDLKAELNKLVEPSKPREGDDVETQTGRVGRVLYVVYLNSSRSVCVKFGEQERFYEFEDFWNYSSKGGRTRWYLG